MTYQEIINFGWNWLTLSSVIILVVTVFRSFTLILQSQRISKSKSGLAVSIPWFTFAGALMVSSFIYGFFANSLMLIISGASAVFYLIVLGLLIKYKGASKFDKASIGFFIIVLILMLFVQQKDMMFLLFQIGNIIGAALQPYELWKVKSAGVLEVSFVLINIFNAVFWIIYSFAFNDWVLKITTPILGAFYVLTYIMWRYYGGRLENWVF